MGQSGGNRVVCSCRLTMRLPYLTSLLLVATVIIADPDVFGDYFDDGMKLVDISQDTALRSCLSDGKTADKTKAAYDECYGQGYDFDDLAKAGGDDDGLPDELEEKEACFYKKMGWVSEDNVMDEAAIAADMEGLEDQIKDGFGSDVGTCVAWSGNFGERRKREAGMEVQGETQDREVVPGLMDTGRRAMGWVKKLVRKVRSPGTKSSKKEKDCKRNKQGKRKNNRGNKKKKARGNKKKTTRGKKNKTTRGKKKTTRGKKNKNTRGKKNKAKRGKKKTTRGKKNKTTRGKKNKTARGKKKGTRRGGKGGQKKESRKQKKNDKSLPEAVYNKLWCIDLAIEQALEKCVEAKIQN